MQPQSPPSHSSPEEREKRPTGVTLIAVLSAISGILLVVAGIVVTLVMPVTVVTSVEGSPSQETVSTLTPALSVTVLALIPASLGAAHLVTASGLLNAKRWAWNAAQVLSIIAIAVSAVVILLSGSLSMAGNIVIAGIILYYLQTRTVKQYFGISQF